MQHFATLHSNMDIAVYWDCPGKHDNLNYFHGQLHLPHQGPPHPRRRCRRSLKHITGLLTLLQRLELPFVLIISEWDDGAEAPIPPRQCVGEMNLLLRVSTTHDPSVYLASRLASYQSDVRSSTSFSSSSVTCRARFGAAFTECCVFLRLVPELPCRLTE